MHCLCKDLLENIELYNVKLIFWMKLDAVQQEYRCKWRECDVLGSSDHIRSTGPGHYCLVNRTLLRDTTIDPYLYIRNFMSGHVSSAYNVGRYAWSLRSHSNKNQHYLLTI